MDFTTTGIYGIAALVLGAAYYWLDVSRRVDSYYLTYMTQVDANIQNRLRSEFRADADLIPFIGNLDSKAVEGIFYRIIDTDDAFAVKKQQAFLFGLGYWVFVDIFTISLAVIVLMFITGALVGNSPLFAYYFVLQCVFLFVSFLMMRVTISRLQEVSNDQIGEILRAKRAELRVEFLKARP